MDSTTVTQTRRALLAGALGGLTAIVAAALGRPQPASAAAGSAMIIGSETNDAGTANTQLLTNSNVVAFKLLQNGPGTALMGYATAATGATRGVYGRTDSPNGYGVQARIMGLNGTGAAIQAIGGNNYGVDASTASSLRPAIYGVNTSGAGVGVLGEAVEGAGVQGMGTAGAGVWGESTSGNGVVGKSDDANGVWASSETSDGLYGFSTSSYAAFLDGRVRVSEYIDITAIENPAYPAVTAGRLFIRDNDSDKKELCILFPTGAVQVLSTEA
jgi:hypothetical protein